MESKQSIVIADEAKTLKAVKRATAGLFLGFFLELALLLLFAFGCADNYRVELILKSTIGLIVFVVGMLSVGGGGTIMVVIQIKTFIKSLSVKESKEHLQAAAYWTNMLELSLSLFLFFAVYMLGVSLVCGGALYSTGIWIAFFACAFLLHTANLAFWKRIYGNGFKTADFIEWGYDLLRFALVAVITVLSANANVVKEIERAWIIHKKLSGAYGLYGFAETLEYVLQAVFSVSSLALCFFLFGTEENGVDGRKVLRKFTWVIASLTVVDCLIYVLLNALTVSTFWGAFGDWFSSARTFYLPILLMTIALHVTHRFPSGAAVCKDFSGTLKKADLDCVSKRVEKEQENTEMPK